VIVQHVDGGGQSADQTIKIKGDKARTDLNPTVTMITNGATGEMITIMHTGRTYLKVSPEQSKAMMEQLQKFRTSPEPAKLQPTGKKEKIGDYALRNLHRRPRRDDGHLLAGEGLSQLPKLSHPARQISVQHDLRDGEGAHRRDIKDFPGMMMKTEIDLGGKRW